MSLAKERPKIRQHIVDSKYAPFFWPSELKKDGFPKGQWSAYTGVYRNPEGQLRLVSFVGVLRTQARKMWNEEFWNVNDCYTEAKDGFDIIPLSIKVPRRSPYATIS